jgi:Fe-S cluster assembly protein SufD
MSTVEAYLDAFENRPKDAADAPVRATRRAAITRFVELGLPTRRQENWRFTNLRPLEQRIFPPAGRAASAPPVLLPAPYVIGTPSHRMVFVNGHFAPALSDVGDPPVNISLQPVSSLLAETPHRLSGMLDGRAARSEDPFLALNAAFFEDGFDLSVGPLMAGDERGPVDARDPVIEIIHLGGATAPISAHMRSTIDLISGESCTVIETFAGNGPYWINAATDIKVGAGARLRHIVLQDDAGEAIHLANRNIKLGANARYEGFVLTLGGELSRQDIHVTIDGEGAYCGIDGAFLLRGAQEATIASLIDHAAVGAQSREIIKGVVEDRAHGVFQGKIRVRPEGQKTDAHQLSKNLLLGERAAIDTKPELEILADDVKCSHGATVGELDETALFYLRARGIDEASARRMLIEAFAADALDLVTETSVRDYLRRHLDRWLADRKD